MTLLHQTSTDEKIQQLINKTKGNYITQGVSFNIHCPRQMSLLRAALNDSNSFSGLIKEMLALRYSDGQQKPVYKVDFRDEKKGNEGKKINKDNVMGWV